MKKSIILFVAGLGLLSCGREIEGNGVQSEKNKNLGSFHNIDASSAFEIHVQQGMNHSVKVEADQNLLEFIDIRQQGSNLKIAPKEGARLKSDQPIKVYIVANDFKKIGISGACQLYSQGLIKLNHPLNVDMSGACELKLNIEAPAIGIDASGSSEIELKGIVKKLKMEGSGASELIALEMPADEADLSISGGGDAKVHVINTLNVSISGAGSVEYKGNPGKIHQDISGAGSVSKIKE